MAQDILNKIFFMGTPSYVTGDVSHCQCTICATPHQKHWQKLQAIEQLGVCGREFTARPWQAGRWPHWFVCKAATFRFEMLGPRCFCSGAAMRLEIAGENSAGVTVGLQL
jgi:hypothetical protein